MEYRNVQIELEKNQHKLIEQQELNQKLKDEKSKAQSPEEIEKKAREDLGLVKPGEIPVRTIPTKSKNETKSPWLNKKSVSIIGIIRNSMWGIIGGISYFMATGNGAIEIGSILEGTITGITNFGAFVQLPDGKVGLVTFQKSQMSMSKILKILLSSKTL